MIRLVSDSSCDIHSLSGADFVSVPLHIISGQRHYVDDETLDVPAMVEELLQYKGKTSTACPNVADWEDAFGEADEVFALTITSSLSGSYNAAQCAGQTYREKHPGRRVHVIDTLSTGPEMLLLLEKLRALIRSRLSFDQITEAIGQYQRKTHLLFMLSSIQNLARNGRTSRLGAEAVGLLGLRICGKASSAGKLEMLGKCRGEKPALERLSQQMLHQGWRGGPVRIAHCLNPQGAQRLKALLLRHRPDAEIQCYPAGGLCSFYAEKGGILVGYEA